MMPNLEFKTRETFGKMGAKRLRREGDVPCTISSAKLGAIHVSLSKKIVDKLVESPKFLAQVFEVEVGGSEKKSQKLKLIPVKVDFHPVSNLVLHIEFNHVVSDEVIALVPVKIVGADKAPGLKKGGKLNLVKYHVPLKCKVESIPDFIEVNIGTFGVGRSIFLSNLTFTKGVEMAYDCLILSITGRGKKDKAEDAAAAAEAAPAGAKPAAAKPAPAKKETK